MKHTLSNDTISIAISMGDPAGIGPEIVAAALPHLCRACRPVIFGHWPTFRQTVIQFPWHASNFPSAISSSEPPPSDSAASPYRFVHCGDAPHPIRSPGLESAQSSFSALERATTAVLTGECKALCTAPVSKEIVNLVSPGFKGHTEYLATRAGLDPDDVTMIFAAERYAIGLITTHLPLKEIPASLTSARYERTLLHLLKITDTLFSTPCCRIGVAALNPHGGEAGLLGSEETDIIAPFCHQHASSPTARISGPIPADVVFRDLFAGRLDGVVAAYHDQALIPLKLSGAGAAVNVTGGLPFVRTSPDHGTAYDIAQTGIADWKPMLQAAHMAIRLCKDDSNSSMPVSTTRDTPPVSGLYFEQFIPGKTWTTERRQLSQEDIRRFSDFSRDQNPIHTPKTDRPLVHGMLTAAVGTGLVSALKLTHHTLVAMVEQHIRYLSPVYAGDTVHGEVKVIQRRETRNPNRGIVVYNLCLKTLNGTVAMDATHTLLVKRKINGEQHEKT